MTTGPFLADTHIILWSISDDRRLSEQHRAILNSEAVVFASAASVWEIAIKRSIGKLQAPDDLPALLPRMRFQPLAVTLLHAHAVGDLPSHHGDPFDRLLIAQAQIENLTILTSDSHFARYNVALA
ncbi:PIN domain-containing protein [Mesorhizobium sp. M2A.F.Ca.ET.037.01.1.1]|uniref:type II toxin-antitoxin system VapC family toxin n=1 Tax=unclassified Mesorhizobium TaxID=325217 RepID=UPI000F757EE5|nr:MULTISPECIES: type II toxin-antitoxin system VapC family toxin [unclassified Mesorhizobium]RUY10772.1 PIN domain-containing protein [Mesorhizobium sp. M2A.F.Ca.ET.040.01.1.1]RVC57635.1 PIN domain-containing protein [Mesorhizobium sp. M00.F.Ca.ET.038.03.1.1]AZO38858.1 type II toxin-antitoxin system VapC family toxin [Mesorhizobium sp. M2A.F.Ca.ET.046.03.2.1]RUX21728.1 PIN domain-containing protein [Mesorhizobium sp. M2A.F.Ca.ET.037.01.1.1]RWA87837.1 MAG: PIN domain-containing protein [Mesorh